MNFVRYAPLLLILTVSVSCKKEQTLDLNVTFVKTGTKGDVERILFTSDNRGILCGGTTENFGYICNTTDGGKSWLQVNLFYPEKKVFDVYMINPVRGYAATEFNYFYTSNDSGKTWAIDWIPGTELAYHEINRPHVRRFDFPSDSIGYFVGGENYEVGVFYRSKDAGDSWEFDTLKHELRGIDFIDNTHGFICGYGYIAKTTNGGRDLIQCDLLGDFFVSVHMFSRNDIICAGQNGGIYRSSDAGTSWKNVLKPNGLFGSRVFINDLYFVDSKTGFVSGDKGLLLRTDDGGETWKTVKTDVHSELNRISEYNGSIYIGTTGGYVTFRY